MSVEIDLDKVTRVEIIGLEGREYVKQDLNPGACCSLQDDGRTLKIFIGDSE